MLQRVEFVRYIVDVYCIATCWLCHLAPIFRVYVH
nr:MAG TPA: hypothetical protein [Caudoviricetes sp.]